MDSDQQRDIVESPLIEDFFDCDKLGSGSDSDTSSSASPRASLKRLSIHFDMSSAQYLTPGVHHPERAPIDGLPLCSSVSQTGLYSSPDLDPYSAVSGVSSFNYPAAADPSLLTPASSAGSPPLTHRQKPLPNFHHSQSSAPGPQAPTPPDSSKMFGYSSSYDVSPGSQGGSPMTMNPAVTEAGAFVMPSYMAHTPPASHGPSSPKTEIPPPIDPYLGHFTVSGANDGDVTHHSLHEYHPYGVQVGPPGAYLGPQHVPVDTPHMHHRMPSNGSPPVLSQPHPSHYRPHSAPQVGAIEDLRDPGLLLGAYPPHAALRPNRRPQAQKKRTSARKPSRTSKSTPRADSSSQFRPEEDGEELTLRDDASEDDKYLFQLRKEFISEKGKGMWEEMKAKYSDKHQGNWEKAALQMKVSRVVAKYGVWPQKEIDRLKEAFEYVENMRYSLIISRMKENGGCRVWDWKTQHIIAMLVKMGLEEPSINQKNGTRRRRQQKAARRQGSPQPGGPPVMGEWPPNGLGLHHPAFHGHAHHVAAQAAARQSQPYDGMMAGGYPMQSVLTPAQEDELLDQVFSNVKAERSLSPDESMDGLSYDNGHDNEAAVSRRPSTISSHELNHQGSARVARQVCERMMPQQPASQGPENPYGPV
ncbi:hypothetical protein C8A05DRAFT_11207 [Staphylotrichum tortipilum]|uniref:Myb-like domain-containing protein n=1 Tax=Staphylotrichum tortipilum TaxID=2831512 RepID=A0AAN6MUS9_9PEZI|nr:hypothetical protein C8A05DRAFT_11246 [Staphylotrichum longicolle]KAK3907080.1 hypothetical protein C8A05DRAFT_11207 [Staphylotrichum longicolle]